MNQVMGNASSKADDAPERELQRLRIETAKRKLLDDAEISAKRKSVAIRTLEAQAALAEVKLKAAAQKGTSDAAKAAAEAQEWQARADVAPKREAAQLEAQIAAARHAARRGRALGLLAFVGGAALLLDYVWHDVEWAIKWRMAYALRKCTPPIAVGAAPVSRFHVADAPEAPFSQVLVMLGPTGCGKSTMLASMADDLLARRVPTVLIRVRNPPDDKTAASSAAYTTEEGQRVATGRARMDRTSKYICEQIGYPYRQSLLARMSGAQWSFSIGEIIHGTVPPVLPSATRLQCALQALFDVCSELCKEREKQGIPVPDALPVIMIDEVQGLVKDLRLAAAGGREIFSLLGGLAVAHCVDRKSTRVALTCSSAYLLREYAEQRLLRDSRVTFVSLGDPSPEAVVTRLEQRGYSAADARAAVAWAGPLQPLLTSARLVSISEWHDAVSAVALRSFDALLRRLSTNAAHTALFVSVMDCVARGESVELRTLPHDFQLHDLSDVFTLQGDDTLVFQSALHRNLWLQRRKQLLKAVRMEGHL